MSYIFNVIIVQLLLLVACCCDDSGEYSVRNQGIA